MTTKIIRAQVSALVQEADKLGVSYGDLCHTKRHPYVPVAYKGARKKMFLAGSPRTGQEGGEFWARIQLRRFVNNIEKKKREKV